MNKEIYVCGLQVMKDYKYVMCPAVAFTDRENAENWCQQANEKGNNDFVYTIIMLEGE